MDLSDYNTVPERIEEFAAKYPDGCLRPVSVDEPYRIVEVGGKTFVVYAALAYRAPDDPLPGFGCAWEPFPGPTQFTRDSELQNAETSAWGRAIVAALAASTKKGIATAEDIQSRAGSERAQSTPAAAPAPEPQLMRSGHALAEAAARAGFTASKDDDENTKKTMDWARRDVLEAATGKRSTKQLSLASEVQAALEAFNGIADGTIEFGYDEEGVPTLRKVPA